ncbi:MAG: hypothetical protein KatS3mg102_2214 [Planctomycetota bacterium]|nr:MAG: hypothetical protein KatS3mg102_2214 [Planctomycetota bacterium]
MSFDLYAELTAQSQCPAPAKLPGGLASGFVEGCTCWFAKGELVGDEKAGARKKNDARNCYMKHAQAGKLTVLKELAVLLDRAPSPLQPRWLAIAVAFTLQAPWYSKDDRPFHVLDNPVRKDRVFGVPFMAAAGWKGLLRWACRMEARLRQHLAEHGTGPEAMQRWEDPDWIVHLFGNAKGEDEEFSRGALRCFPTWFDRIGFEVINPHDRARRAGTHPILYEVVPAGTAGTLRLLYAPAPGLAERQGVKPAVAVGRLLDATEKLLRDYGFSAKRTAGWGIARIDRAEIRSARESECGTMAQVRAALGRVLGQGGRTG